jgi:hypothetical protein
MEQTRFDKFHILMREFFASVVLSILWTFLTLLYVRYQMPFLERILDTLTGALIMALVGNVVGRMTKPNNLPDVNVEKTDSVKIGNTGIQESRKEE